MNTQTKKQLVRGFNFTVMMEHIEYVELGIRTLDDGYYKALYLRQEDNPTGKFLKLTSRIERAICTANLLHSGQLRKNPHAHIPYISHPLCVAERLALHTEKETVLCAGLLHDTLEDTEYTKEQMIDDFGEKNHDEEIYEIVNDVTEQDKSLPWNVRKQEAIAHIAYMKEESLLVKTADVIENLTQQMEGYQRDGEEFFNRFHAGKADQLAMRKAMVAALSHRWPENPMIADLEQLIRKAIQLWER